MEFFFLVFLPSCSSRTVFSLPLHTVRVSQRGDDVAVQLLQRDAASGADKLVAICPISADKVLDVGLDHFFEPVVDSSRYFVVRIVNPRAKRHAYLGFGFADRPKAVDLKATVHDWLAYVRRHRGRAASDDAAGGDDGTARGGTSLPGLEGLSLGPSDQLQIRINVGGSQAPAAGAGSSSAPSAPAGGLLRPPPPPAAAPPTAAVAAAAAPPPTTSASAGATAAAADDDDDEWGDFQGS